MKAETIIVLAVVIVFGLIAGILFYVYSHDKQLDINSVKTFPNNVQIDNANLVNVDTQVSNFTELVSNGNNVCEGCHLSGKKIYPQAYQVKQHVEGGAYCLECHTIDHNVHPMSPKNKNVTCGSCHGTASPQVPTFRNGNISCANCHDYPDPLKPSNGNLIVIHRERNVDCIKCHLDSSASCLKCHTEIKSDDKWTKRLNHFNTIVKAAQ
ncbi:MAG: cytochrome c3 family protein [Candidatus Methanoperedens sp.]